MNKTLRLQIAHLSTPAQVSLPQAMRMPLDADASVVRVMTDFCHHEPLVVGSSASLKVVQQMFLASHETDMLVEDSAHQLIGVISRSEFQDGKVLAVVERLRKRYAELEVSDVMMPVARLGRVSLREACAASVAQVRQAMDDNGDRHLLVTRGDAADSEVCGLISSDQIRLALKGELAGIERATSFAELEQRLFPLEIH